MEKENTKTKFNFKNFLKSCLIILFLLFTLFYVYIRFIEPKMIIVHESAIIEPNLPDSFNGLKIVHFSDIHYGATINDKEFSKITQKINSLNPDVIVFTGDLFDDAINISESNITNIKTELQSINAKLKKYAVIGDSDYINKDLYMEIMKESGFTVLENTNDLLYYQGLFPIMFIGTSSLLEKEDSLENAIKVDEVNTDYFKIWLGHEPELMDKLIAEDLHPNLVFAGHTLGGLINMPIGGYLLKQDGISDYTNNYYHKKKISMYISNGLGTHTYKVRFFNQPSINFYRLYNS